MFLLKEESPRWGDLGAGRSSGARRPPVTSGIYYDGRVSEAANQPQPPEGPCRNTDRFFTLPTELLPGLHIPYYIFIAELFEIQSVLNSQLLKSTCPNESKSRDAGTEDGKVKSSPTRDLVGPRTLTLP